MTETARGHLAMLAFSMLIAGSFALGSIVANDLAPVALNAIRFVIAAAVVGGMVMATGGLRRADWQAPWRYLILGGLFGFYFVMMFEGLKTAPPVSTSAVFTLTPILSGLFGWMLLRQHMTRRMALALAIGGVGALCVIFRGSLPAFLAFEIGRGEMIFFVGVIAHAIYTPMIAKLNRGESPLVFALGTLIAGGIVLLVWGWRDILAAQWLTLPAIVWITILYVAVFASSLTTVLIQFASLRLPSAKVMAYTYLTPCWVILWEIALGNGLPSALILGGVGLTIVALLMLLRHEPQGS